MAAVQLLLDCAVVLIAAEIGGTAFRRIRLPRAVGMLVAGILLGPFTPGYVVDPTGPTRGGLTVRAMTRRSELEARNVYAKSSSTRRLRCSNGLAGRTTGVPRT